MNLQHTVFNVNSDLYIDNCNNKQTKFCPQFTSLRHNVILANPCGITSFFSGLGSVIQQLSCSTKIPYQSHQHIQNLTSFSLNFAFTDNQRVVLQLYSTVTLRQGEKKHYNNKVDVYSFGIVLWELLTNKMPFEGMSNLQAAYAAAFKVHKKTCFSIRT